MSVVEQVTPVFVEIDCAMRSCDPIAITPRTTCRDIYMHVSEGTGISQRKFTLIYRFQKIPDCGLPLSDYGVTTNSRITLVPNIQTGATSDNIVGTDPVMERVEQYVCSLSVPFIKKFFLAEETLRVRVPFGDSWGTLKFRLNRPIQNRAPLDQEVTQTPLMHSAKQIDTRTLQAQFDSEYSP